MRVLGANELARDVQKGGLCIGCGACVHLCPYFRNYRGRTVQLFPCTLSQGRCYAACPKAEVDLDELARINWGRPYEGKPIGMYELVLSAKAGKKMPAGPYQGGGTVSALLMQAMNQGLIEAAVLTGSDKEGPVPMIVESVSEIVACASSKFGATATLEALNRAVIVGRGNLGVVGTPCQVTAVAKMRSNPLCREDFVDPVSLVIGLFCNWSLDQRLIKAYLSSLVDLSRIKGLDIPPPPANILRVDLGDDILEISLDKVRAFIPDTCGLCPDMTSEWADLSVGMYEGRAGWNTLLVRTAKGRELVEAAIETGMLITEPMPATNIEHLSEASAAKKQRAFQALRQRGLVNCTGEAQHSVLRVSTNTLDRIMKAYKGGDHA